jgi:lipoprotein-anchoring transpeptidase ErfK/SrfK
MRNLLGAALLMFAALSTQARAGAVEARIDISEQRMNVYQNGVLRHSWAISSGRKGYVTPTGNYRPTRLTKMHYSRKYNNSPMPYSIFFRGGYAIHGTGAVKQLGRPASHGCIRLHTDNAKALYSMVKSAGAKNTKISITH